MYNSIILLNYNSFEIIKNLLDTSLMGISNKYNIIIVDNNSTDRTGEQQLLKSIENNSTIIYIQHKENGGYATGNNIGIKKAQELGSQYAFVINPDISIPDIKIFDSMVNDAKDIDNFTLMGPKIDNITPYYTRPFILTFLFPFLLRSLDKFVNWILNKYLFNIEFSIVKVYKLYGCFMLVHIELFDNIGMFDERTFLYGEENIIAEKLFKNNLTMYHNNKFYVNHDAQGSTKILGYKIFKYFYKSNVLYLKEYRKYSYVISNIFAVNEIVFRVIINKVKGLI